MKLKIKNSIIAGVFLLLASSCNLDRFPYDSIESSQAFQTVKDAKSWNNGMYSQFRGRQYGLFTFSTDVQGDQLNATLEFGNRNGFPHRWEGFLAGDYTLRDTWQPYYSAITSINIALAGFETIPVDNDEQTRELNRYKGDAHLARAYYYHKLVSRFAKSYDPTTASSDLGVPLVVAYDVYDMPARASVKEVYDFILTDIAAAKANLASFAGSQGATRFNIDVVTALEARVKLDMQDFAGAKAAADILINTQNYPLITDQEKFISMWKNDFSQEDIFQSYTNKPNELANANSIYLGYNAGLNKYTPDFVPSQWVIDAYADNDIRKAAYFEKKLLYIDGKDFPDVYLVNKFPGNPELFTGANTNYQHAPKVFRIAEMYLISAEAAARSGSGDALTPLNALRTARGLAAINATGAALFEAVKEERFRELAFEGFRLNDLMRWGEGFTRHDPQNLDLIQTGPNYYNLSKTAGDDKFVWGIPSNDVTVNPNIVQNQGW